MEKFHYGNFPCKKPPSCEPGLYLLLWAWVISYAGLGCIFYVRPIFQGESITSGPVFFFVGGGAVYAIQHNYQVVPYNQINMVCVEGGGC